MRRSGEIVKICITCHTYIDPPTVDPLKKDPVTGQNYIHMGFTVTTWKFRNIHENPNFIS